MNWYKRIKTFLLNNDNCYLEIGDRDLNWIKNFEKDLKRWNLPVKIVITNPVIYKGKVSVSLEKLLPGEIEGPKD